MFDFNVTKPNKTLTIAVFLVFMFCFGYLVGKIYSQDILKIKAINKYAPLSIPPNMTSCVPKELVVLEAPNIRPFDDYPLLFDAKEDKLLMFETSDDKKFCIKNFDNKTAWVGLITREWYDLMWIHENKTCLINRCVDIPSPYYTPGVNNVTLSYCICTLWMDDITNSTLDNLCIHSCDEYFDDDEGLKNCFMACHKSLWIKYYS